MVISFCFCRFHISVHLFLVPAPTPAHSANMINSRAWLRKYLPILGKLPSSSSFSPVLPSDADPSSSSSSSSSSSVAPREDEVVLDIGPPETSEGEGGVESGADRGLDFGPFQSFLPPSLAVADEQKDVDERREREETTPLIRSASRRDQLVLSADSVSADVEQPPSSNRRVILDDQHRLNRMIDSWEEVHGS